MTETTDSVLRHSLELHWQAVEIAWASFAVRSPVFAVLGFCMLTTIVIAVMAHYWGVGLWTGVAVVALVTIAPLVTRAVNAINFAPVARSLFDLDQHLPFHAVMNALYGSDPAQHPRNMMAVRRAFERRRITPGAGGLAVAALNALRRKLGLRGSSIIGGERTSLLA